MRIMHGNEWVLFVVVLMIIGFFVFNYENFIRDYLQNIWYKILKRLVHD